MAFECSRDVIFHGNTILMGIVSKMRVLDLRLKKNEMYSGCFYISIFSKLIKTFWEVSKKL